MPRPTLTPDLPVTEFQSYYWLKEELLAFCREQGLYTQGSKADLAARIVTFLQGGTRTLPPPRYRQAQRMPPVFTRESRIGAGWRCTESLRTFFQSEIGSHFHFDQVMRDFIAQGEGKTLEEAIEVWQQPRQPTTIAPQFEYNRHMRTFFETHPDATREEAVRTWNEQRSQRRPPPEEA